MKSQSLKATIISLSLLAPCAFAQSSNSCTGLMNFKAAGVEILKTTPIAEGTTEPNPRGMPGTAAPLPANCRVEGVIDRRTGVGDEEFGIRFALAMPDKWNGDFLMQGGGGGNGVVLPPLGTVAAAGAPALMRGFAVVSTDTGHKSHAGAFDFNSPPAAADTLATYEAVPALAGVTLPFGPSGGSLVGRSVGRPGVGEVHGGQRSGQARHAGRSGTGSPTGFGPQFDRPRCPGLFESTDGRLYRSRPSLSDRRPPRPRHRGRRRARAQAGLGPGVPIRSM